MTPWDYLEDDHLPHWFPTAQPGCEATALRLVYKTLASNRLLSQVPVKAPPSCHFRKYLSTVVAKAFSRPMSIGVHSGDVLKDLAKVRGMI